MKWLLSAVLLCSVLTLEAQLPAFGSKGRIDLGSWNLMWYGHSVYGSKNKAYQRNAVAEVLRNSKVDIWFFQEICDTSDFSTMLSENGPFQHVYAHYWQSQKTAWVWDTTQWIYLSDSLPFKDYPQDFAGGRLPLLVILRAKNSADTLVLMGVHLKAHTGSPEQLEMAWMNRKASADHLFEWQKWHHDRKVIVTGDWNDGIDKSLYADTISPFESLKHHGHFLLEKQALAGEKSWYYGTTCIDHIWVNETAWHSYQKESSQILPFDWYFTNYPEQVSDHFPVFATFGYESVNLPDPSGAEDPRLFPNPSRGTFYIRGQESIKLTGMMDLMGRKVSYEVKEQDGDLIIQIARAGIYSLFMECGGQVFVYRLVVNP